MKPESEWFRPPQFHEMARMGDHRRFLWIAEPELFRERGSKGIFGVGYSVAESDAWSMPLEELTELHRMLREAAKTELYRRISAGESVGEGSDFMTFQWNPVIVRDENGKVLAVQSPEKP